MVSVSHQRLQLSTTLMGWVGIREGIMVSPPCCAVGRHSRHGDRAEPRWRLMATSPRSFDRTLVITINLVNWL